MVVEEVVNASGSIVLGIGQLGNWLQALGIIVVLYIIFEAVTTWFNYKRWKEMGEIKRDMERMEGKLNKLLKKR